MPSWAQTNPRKRLLPLPAAGDDTMAFRLEFAIRIVLKRYNPQTAQSNCHTAARERAEFVGGYRDPFVLALSPDVHRETL